ncbi:rho guanine nucleotide exchange factor 28 isoform X2 [Protopterus annectens]|uniref:rho guanine nucleotide exchange factor 28 isoform X2 n=1 Tax=Protopterus annectens TaxID=7888 RepID=UPI001CFAAC4C|nr:rho guanine nucleotide exchange factor 28 isoform X2 [Protopterus annectens]
MQLSCTEVPLYGQSSVMAEFDKLTNLEEDANFYFVFGGSNRRHVTSAHKVNETCLHSVVPGHDVLESVSVTIYKILGECSPTLMGTSTLTYVQDKIWEMSQFLLTQANSITSTSHLMLLARFGLAVEALQSLDSSITKAIAHADVPVMQQFAMATTEKGSRCKESLLHLSVRLGLRQLSKFLISQPGGLIALTLPNEDGVTLVDLASHNGFHQLAEILIKYQNVHIAPSAGVIKKALDSSTFLEFCHESGTLALTVSNTMERSVQADIELLRKCSEDRHFQREVSDENPQEDGVDRRTPHNSEEVNDQEQLVKCSAGDSDDQEDCGTEKSTGNEQLTHFRDDVCNKDEEQDLSDSEKQQSSLNIFGKNRATPFTAVTSHPVMLIGKDEIYTNCMAVDEVEDVCIKYNIDGITTESSSTESPVTDPVPETQTPSLVKDSTHIIYELSEENNITDDNAEDISHLHSNSFSSFNLSSTFPTLQPYGFNGMRSPSGADISKRSSSPDALDADSEDEGNSDRSPCIYPSMSQGFPAPLTSSGDELDSFDVSPESDISSTRTESLSSNTSLHSKDPLESASRLRSYSYSSPKTSAAKHLFVRDLAPESSEEQRAYSLSEQSKEKREISFRKRALSAEEEEDEGSPELADSLQHLTLSEFLKEIEEEEEWDKHINTSKASESEKYKVSRTFSFIKNRMTSQRNKSKAKSKDGKEKIVNGHHLLLGSSSGTCIVCNRNAAGKDVLQCVNCTVIVHKGCKDSLLLCTKQKSQERNQSFTKSKPIPVLQSSFKDTPSLSETVIPVPSSLPTLLPSIRKDLMILPTIRHPPFTASLERKHLNSSDTDTENTFWRPRSHSDEQLEPVETPTSTESFVIEDTVDAQLHSDLFADSLEFEADSWSLVVDQTFCSKYEKDVVNRQDVIYELMQTEMHHIQTLTIMSEIFRKGVKELQLESGIVDRLFPCLDGLLELHKHFFHCLKERRQESCEENNDRNFLIDRVGDILVQQFSEENANKMKHVYGEFCSHHMEAVNLFKELLQTNKKFHHFIKLQSSNFLARRLGLPECILLVTQRITKYPVLLERILQYSKEGTEEHKDVTRAVGLIKDILAAVDLKVNEYGKEQKLLEITNKMENKAVAKMKNGRAFRKSDLISRGRILLHEGVVYWKTATGRLKDIQAVLLTDVLVFLQEKDQKYTFAVVDQKPPVISLQKLIVREVANEERGMFLISASTVGPEMYEIHTNSKEERNSWMRLIREAVESCPEEEERTSESEEDKRIAEAKVAKIQRIQEILSTHDMQIYSLLQEKLQIYAELACMSNYGNATLEPQLLVKPDVGEVPQASLLLTAALQEVESLLSVVDSQAHSPGSPIEDSTEELSITECNASMDTYESTPDSSTDRPITTTSGVSSQSLNSDTEEAAQRSECDFDTCLPQTEPETDEFNLQKIDYLCIPGSSYTEIVQCIQNLTQLLYSIEAAVAMQDSYTEVQRLLLQECEKMSRTYGSRGTGNLLLEQEKHRNLEKQKEETVNVQKLQNQFEQERQRWMRECELRRRDQERQANWLRQREQECQQHEAILHRDREELDTQLQEYQQSLERLREGQLLVEKEKEKLELEQKLLQTWKHSQQSSFPSVYSLDNDQVTSRMRSESFDENCIFVNEAAMQMPMNSCNPSNTTSGLLCTDNLLNTALRTSGNETDILLHSVSPTSQPWNSTDVHYQVATNTGNIMAEDRDAYSNDIRLLHMPLGDAFLPVQTETSQSQIRLLLDIDTEDIREEEDIVYI